MFKRFLKIFPVLLAVLLLGVLCFANGVQASDCNHEWSKWTGRDGQHRRECLRCGSVITGECEYHGIILRPTCTEGGHTTYTCTQCGDSYVTDETQPVGHSWDAGTQTKAPDCDDTGTILYTCLECNATREETIPATGVHNVVNIPAVAATCTKEGLTMGVHCDECGLVYKVQTTIAKIPHDWDTKELKAPTCEPGLEELTCKSCGLIEEKELPATQEHTRYVTKTEVKATCTTDGSTQNVICSVCETVLFPSEVIPALGHNWQVTVYTQPTCTTDGLCDRSCTRCPVSEENHVLPATGHNLVSTPAKAATCLEAGYTASLSCANCAVVIVESAPTEPLGHNYQVSSVREPTCTSDGRTVYACTRCTKSYDNIITKLGHDLYTAETREPTCTTMGLILEKCTRCSHSITQSIKAKGHDELYCVIAPTCTADGYTAVTCSRCEYSGTINQTSATGHDNEVMQTIPPTCTQGGYSKLRCKTCGTETEDMFVAANGHTWSPGLVVAPTCEEDGYTLFSCLFCTEEKKEAPVAASGHILTEATANGDGTHNGICKVCSQSVTENCSGGIFSCLELAVCSICNGNYGVISGEHSFTKYTAVDNSYHRLDCSLCQEQGTVTEQHSFVKGDFLALSCAYEYNCRVCSHKVWGRPIGDADGNGTIGDSGDARAALRYSVGLDIPTDAAKRAADADRDGTITAEDARLILRVSVGLEQVTWSVLFVNEDGSLPN